LEDDDEVIGGGGEDMVVAEDEEGREADDDEITTTTGMSAYNNKEKGKGKVKKKATFKRRKTGVKKSDTKVGYSEGAEENKGCSFENSQTTFSMENGPTSSTVVANQGNTGPNYIMAGGASEVDPDGMPKPKLKQAFLLRPPNNTITVIKSMFNKRQG
jgi:hypothetical protein